MSRANPFKHMNEWWWVDADQRLHGPYGLERWALRDLLAYVYHQKSPNWWSCVWAAISHIGKQ
jgi:hypothetical protein